MAMALEGEPDFTGHVSEQLLNVASAICRMEPGTLTSKSTARWTGDPKIFPDQPTLVLSSKVSLGPQLRGTRLTLQTDDMGLVISRTDKGRLDTDELAADFLNKFKGYHQKIIELKDQ